MKLLLILIAFSQVEVYHVPGSVNGVAWGNGTGAPVSYYRPLIRELNSRGVSVVAATTKEAWSGEEITFAGEVLVELGCTRIIAMGHSQGAGGALRAARDNPDLFNAVCPIMPAAKLDRYGKQPCFMVIGERDLASVKSGSAYIRETYAGPMLYAERLGLRHYATSDAELIRRVVEFAKTGKATLDTRYWRRL